MDEQIVNTVFEIAGKEYNVVKYGAAQARQVALLAQWFSMHGMKALSVFKNEDVEKMGTWNLIMALLGGISDEAVLDLFTVVFGCPGEVSREHFDIGLLVDGIDRLYNYQPSVKRVVNRFFSGASSQNAGENSTTSA